MKLLICRECQDVFKLWVGVEKTCQCGLTKGEYYRDGLNAKYSGPCVPIGFSNSSLKEAVYNQPESGDGKIFTAFVIPRECPTMERVPHQV